MALSVVGRDFDEVARLEAQALPAGSNTQKSTWDRVKNVVWIKKNTVYKEALEDWEREIKVQGERLVRREKRKEELNNQVYNLVGFFSVFQGVILTAVTQLTQSSSSSSSGSAAACVCSRPLCGKVWFPIVLSVLAAVAAGTGISLKFSDIHEVENLIHNERWEERALIKRESDLRQFGENFRFHSLKQQPLDPLNSHFFLKFFVIIGAISVFSGVLILSYVVILCDKLVVKRWG